jgi:L-malate glycosyltransferase
MPKIAHFIDSLDPGGAEMMVIDICRSIGRYGFSPVVYHFGNAWLEKRCKELDIPTVCAPGRDWFISSKTLPLFFIAFTRFLREQGVDLLHSHLFGAITGASVPARCAGIPHVGTLHDLYTIEEKRRRVRWLQLASLLGTQLVAVTRQIKDYLDRTADFNRRPIATIVNGVDTVRFATKVDRKQSGICSDHTVFICVGRLERIKGHDVLLRAFKKMAANKLNHLLIVGDGPCREEIEHQVTKSGLQDRVRLLGHRDDIPQLLAASDCFVLSSRSEGLSCSIIEAMAAGLPIIATDVGGNKDLVEDGVNGYLVPSENEELLSRSMDAMSADRPLAKIFGARSLEKARLHFSLEATVKSYVGIYEAEMKKNGK